MAFVVYIFFLFCCCSTISARPYSEFLSKIRTARDEDYIIRRNEQDPCPIVVAPFNAGGNLNWGPLANFGTFFRGYSKQTGPFDTSFGGNGNLMQGGGLGIGGWNQIVPNRSTDKDCHNNQQQQTPINPNFGG